MLVGLANTPRDYAWGATDLIPRLQGRVPTGAPEAEVWFGDHAGSPARVLDGSGRTLDAWLADQGAPRLPFLLKLLAAGAPLSIQAHPSRAQAEDGFAREEGAGIDRAAPHRNYRDANHKPEVIVALSERFDALAGIRPLAETARLLDALGDRPGVRALRARLSGGVEDTIAWLLAGDAPDVVADVVSALDVAASAEVGDELGALRAVARAHPGDPGVVVALLLHLVRLRRGEALFVSAGVLHAYLGGLGVEIMAASDNVLRGGLTSKHVDVDELLRVVDAAPGPAPVLPAERASEGVDVFAPVPDFALRRVRVPAAAAVPVDGPAIVLATAGRVVVRGASDALALGPGEALVAVAEQSLVLEGDGELFLATRG